jgi:hypothetical protein
VRTFIPKVAEGVFTVIFMFNQTDEYVLYYHSGKKTLRVFRYVRECIATSLRFRPHPRGQLSWFASILPVHSWESSSKLGHNCFLPHPFQFITPTFLILKKYNKFWEELIAYFP